MTGWSLPSQTNPPSIGSEVNPDCVWETCCAGPGREVRKQFKLPRFLPVPHHSSLMGLLGSVGQRNTGVVLVLVTVLIYWTNFFSKRELVLVERESEQTGLGWGDQVRRRTGWCGKIVCVLVSVHVLMWIKVSDVCICMWQPRSLAECALTWSNY